MPWDGQSFAKHNHSLTPAQSEHAARIANAVLRSGASDGIAIATANKWAQNHGGIAHRDEGGGIDPTSGIGGFTPSAQTENPAVQGMLQRYATVPTEKLAELSARLGATPQGRVIQQILAQRRVMPQAQQPTQTAGYRRGGSLKRAGGGSFGAPSGASPWWARREASGAEGFLHGSTPGRADAVETTAPGGSHVIPADVIAGLGAGNSLAGARVMQGILDSGPYGTAMPHSGRAHGLPAPPHHVQQFQADGGETESLAGGGKGRGTPVALSHGEFVVSPHHVAAWGHGDPKLGHRVWDRWIVETRKRQITETKKLKPPVGYKKKAA